MTNLKSDETNLGPQEESPASMTEECYGKKSMFTPEEERVREKARKKQEKRHEKEAVSFRRIFSYVSDYYWLMTLGGICGIVSGAALPAFSLIIGLVLNILVPCGPDDQNLNPTCLHDKTVQIVTYAMIFLSLGVGSFILVFTQNSTYIYVGEKLTMRIRIAYFRSLMHQDVKFFDKNKTAELTSRLSSDIILIQNGTSDKVGLALFFTSQMLSSIIIAFIKDWRLTLVVLSISPLLVFAGLAQTQALTSVSNREQTLYSKASQITEETISGYRTVSSFVRNDQEVERYSTALEMIGRKTTKKKFFQAFGFAFAYFVIFGAYTVAFGYGGSRVIRAQMLVGDMMTVIFSVAFGAFGLGQFAQLSPDFAKARGAAVEIFRTIDSRPDINPNLEKGVILENMKGQVVLKDVDFIYPIRPDVTVLNKLSLECPAGRTTALCGSSGCGKSTTIALIERFYDPVNGGVLIDGVDVRDFNLNWLREQIGLVSQEPILFATTILNNIRYGKPDASMEEIIAAATRANAYNFIMQLPDKFETEVGEKGTQLSGGQKQRIAIARAILKNPVILLLDEATSALDAESEALVQDALEKLMVGRTSIVIAHRLSTIQKADLIYTLGKGAVLESGTHEELLAKNGFYFQLVTKQLQ